MPGQLWNITACVGISSQAAVRKIDAMKSCLTCKRVFNLSSAHLTSKCRYYEGRIKDLLS
ncbi:hypothetical protein FOMG_09480 [Fusarium oxysporum f. sp. melonis 26406]|uniref:Uncharacterized protein n=1 Tax=Fusarium oxysporum f. sp. melonis 26406 TaxID=1089452 RepID=X0A5Y3_FUSOX|nr:hypothetical protein FOMG_09480 [Fusarium oxysporum f. sp. melonis 26406]